MDWSFRKTLRAVLLGLLMVLVFLPFGLAAKQGFGPALLGLFFALPIGLGQDLKDAAFLKALLLGVVGSAIEVVLFELWMVLTDAEGRFHGRFEDWAAAAMVWVAFFAMVLAGRGMARSHAPKPNGRTPA